MKSGLIFLLAVPFLICKLFAQTTPIKDSIPCCSIEKLSKKTSITIGSRYAFISTINEPSLSNYHANGFTAYAIINTGSWKGFELSGGGAFLLNINSSDLTEKDAVTKQSNRYEIGLFDVSNYSKKQFFKTETLFLKYAFKKFKAMAGNFALDSPYINPQDGRLRPTFEQGIWLNFDPKSGLIFEGGWLIGISPRSTSKWYSIGNSLGLYPQGVSTTGKKGQYQGLQHSEGIGLLGISKTFKNNLDIKFWNQYVDNIFNSTLIQMEYKVPVYAFKAMAGIQYHYQQKQAMEEMKFPNWLIMKIKILRK